MFAESLVNKRIPVYWRYGLRQVSCLLRIWFRQVSWLLRVWFLTGFLFTESLVYTWFLLSENWLDKFHYYFRFLEHQQGVWLYPSSDNTLRQFSYPLNIKLPHLDISIQHKTSLLSLLAFYYIWYIILFEPITEFIYLFPYGWRRVEKKESFNMILVHMHV